MTRRARTVLSSFSVLAAASFAAGAPAAPKSGSSASSSSSSAAPLPKLAAPAPKVIGGSFPALDSACAAKLPEDDRAKPPLGWTSAPPIPFEGFFEVPSPIGPRTDAGGDVAIELALPKTVAVGAKLSPTIGVENHGKKRVSVVRPIDGSFDRVRLPAWDLYVRDEATQKTWRYGRAAMRCGNVNAVAADDHLVVPPGKSVKLATTGFADHLARASLPKKGTYTVWVVYAFCGYRPSPLDLGVNVFRSDAAVGVFPSNPVKITVK